MTYLQIKWLTSIQCASEGPEVLVSEFTIGHVVRHWRGWWYVLYDDVWRLWLVYTTCTKLHFNFQRTFKQNLPVHKLQCKSLGPIYTWILQFLAKMLAAGETFTLVSWLSLVVARQRMSYQACVGMFAWCWVALYLLVFLCALVISRVFGFSITLFAKMVHQSEAKWMYSVPWYPAFVLESKQTASFQFIAPSVHSIVNWYQQPALPPTSLVVYRRSCMTRWFILAQSTSRKQKLLFYIITSLLTVEYEQAMAWL